MEVGSVATPFEHRSFGEELALCQRYYVKSFDYATTPAHNLTAEHEAVCCAFAANNAYGASINFPVEMRATPTLSIYNSSNIGGTNGRWAVYNGSWASATGGTFVASSSKGFSTALTGDSLTQFNAYLVNGNWACESEL